MGNNMINALLSTELFGTTITDVILDSIKANKGNFNTLLSAVSLPLAVTFPLSSTINLLFTFKLPVKLPSHPLNVPLNVPLDPDISPLKAAFPLSSTQKLPMLTTKMLLPVAS